MNEREPQQSEESTEELLRRLVSHPRIRQAIMSGVAAAVMAEMAVLGLQGLVDVSQLVNAGKVEVSAARLHATKIVPERTDCTGGGGRC